MLWATVECPCFFDSRGIGPVGPAAKVGGYGQLVKSLSPLVWSVMTQNLVTATPHEHTNYT